MASIRIIMRRCMGIGKKEAIMLTSLLAISSIVRNLFLNLYAYT